MHRETLIVVIESIDLKYMRGLGPDVVSMVEPTRV